MLSRFIAMVLALGLLMSSAFADDWVAVKLRGQVLQLVDGNWQPLQRGDVVPDDRVVRTLNTARVEFQRDAELIALGPNTQIQIVDKSGKRFTTVKQYFGEVAIEAEVQNVQHFAVQTPFLAAVVKGTRFTVRTSRKSSGVEVERGHVAVESLITHSSTLLSAGQSATASQTEDLKVAGKGELPVVIGADGETLSVDGIPVAADKAAGKLGKEVEKAADKATKAAEKAAAKAAKTVTKTVSAVGGTATQTVGAVSGIATGTVTTVTGTVTTVTKTAGKLLKGIL